jgi:D-glycero-alpha-D-manno-heptose-7-phosphate kinase
MVRCDAPPGSGTGSSASIGVALLGLVDALRRAMDASQRVLSRYELADMACQIEHELGIVGGKQDQYAAALGGVNYMEFYDQGRVAVQPMELPRSTLNELEKHLVLCYSGESRLSGDTNQRMMSAYLSGDPTVQNALRDVKRIAQDIAVALRAGDTLAFAELLEQETRARVKLCDGVMTPAMAKLRQAALDAGAIGGKICGAGGGGCMLFCSRPDAEGAVARALRSAGGLILDFNFDHAGLQVWEPPMTARA